MHSGEALPNSTSKVPGDDRIAAPSPHDFTRRGWALLRFFSFLFASYLYGYLEANLLHRPEAFPFLFVSATIIGTVARTAFAALRGLHEERVHEEQGIQCILQTKLK